MKRFTIPVLAAAMLAGMFVIAGCETQHSESTSPTLTGGTKHEETTTTKNPITGQTTVEHNQQRTPGQ